MELRYVVSPQIEPTTKFSIEKPDPARRVDVSDQGGYRVSGHSQQGGAVEFYHVVLEDVNSARHFADLVAPVETWHFNADVPSRQSAHGFCQSHERPRDTLIDRPADTRADDQRNEGADPERGIGRLFPRSVSACRSARRRSSPVWMVLRSARN